MSSRNGRKSIVVATALLTLVTHAGPARADPIVSLIPSATMVYVGDTFWLDVAIGLTDPSASDDVADLYGFQFSLMFDPAMLAASEPTEGEFLARGGGTFYLPGEVDPVGGSVGLTGNTLLAAIPGVSGSGVLASMMFTAQAVGTGLVVFNTDPLLGGILLDSELGDIAASWIGAEITVAERPPAPVPEPASLLLVAMGAALAFARRGRRRL